MQRSDSLSVGSLRCTLAALFGRLLLHTSRLACHIAKSIPARAMVNVTRRRLLHISFPRTFCSNARAARSGYEPRKLVHCCRKSPGLVATWPCWMFLANVRQIDRLSQGESCCQVIPQTVQTQPSCGATPRSRVFVSPNTLRSNGQAFRVNAGRGSSCRGAQQLPSYEAPAVRTCASPKAWCQIARPVQVHPSRGIVAILSVTFPGKVGARTRHDRLLFAEDFAPNRQGVFRGFSRGPWIVPHVIKQFCSMVVV